MPSRGVGVTDTDAGTGIVDVSVHERGDPNLATTTTADPGSGGATLAVTSAARFPATNNYKVQVEKEVMLVTAGAGTTSWTVTRGIDGTTAVAHAIGVTVQQVVGIQRVLPVSDRAISFLGKTASFRTLGNAATPQNLFTIENAAGSAVLIGVRKLVVEMDATAVLVTQGVEFKTSRPASLPSAGTTLGKVAMDSALASNASVVCRGATASDGGAATAITATAGTVSWHRFGPRLHTAVGQVMVDDLDVLPAEVVESDTEILRASQSLLVQVTHQTAASNAATNHYVVKCVWEEFVIP